ncbi:MAG: alpha-galactosidase [Bacilli bacterium]|nr:alpha-galactosidase [Bacilli bacterium]
MRVYYLKNGKKKKAEYTNKDIVLATTMVDNRTTVVLKAKADISLLKAEEIIPFHVNYGDLYFLNGYQSWTDTKEFKLNKRLRNIKKSPHIITRKFAMDKYGDSSFYKYSIKKSHGYDIFYSKGEHESFIYNLNYQTAYLIVELIKDRRNIHLLSDVKGLKLKAGEEATIFDYRLFYSYQEGLETFEKDFPKKDIEKLFGYTSWYNYYQNINEEIILRDLEALDKRFNVFQIDDGYETFVGDWLNVDGNKFPHGLKPIVDKIHEKGFKAGIWLAPFAAETKSKLFLDHPDWIKKDKKGRFVKAGGNWSGFYALDLDNEEAVNYIKTCLNHYMDLGFDFFKLDFLYASALEMYDGKTRCQKQNEAYQLLRGILKDKLILGCGANIINSYNHFDYLRVGPDVSLSFDDVFYMRLFHRERVSTKVTLQNTIYRSLFNQRLFANDPDVFLLRDDNISLSFSQRVALTKINALFGSMLMTSDDIATYDEKKKRVLDEALDLFKNAKVIGFERKGNYIDIHYLYKNVKHLLVYNTEKGVFSNE